MLRAAITLITVDAAAAHATLFTLDTRRRHGHAMPCRYSLQRRHALPYMLLLHYFDYYATMLLPPCRAAAMLLR